MGPQGLLEELAFDATFNKRWGTESEVTDIRRRADVLGVACEISLLLACLLVQSRKLTLPAEEQGGRKSYWSHEQKIRKSLPGRMGQ